MKKAIKAIVSLTLAGSMAFGLSACNKSEDGEGSALLKAIDATLNSQNYAMSMTTGVDATFYYDGEPLKADTVISTQYYGDLTGAEILYNADLIQSTEDFANPVYKVYSEGLYECDFAGGKVHMATVHNGEASAQYVEVEGTTVNLYYDEESYEMGGDPYNPTVTYTPAKNEYTGFKNSDQAKTVLRSEIKSTSSGMSLENILEVKVKGIGANSSKEGTLKELVDLFDYDGATGTYSATVDASAMGGSLYSELKIAITVVGGKVSELNVSVPAEAELSDRIYGMPDEFTYEGTSFSSIKYYNYGSTSVTIPAESKQVDSDHIYTVPVLTSEGVWKTLLEDYGTTEFKILDAHIEVVDDAPAYIYTNIYVDTDAKVAAVDKMNYSSYQQSVTYYKVANGKLSTYIGQSNYGFLSGYGEPTVTDITLDETSALLAALPTYAKDYGVGFSGGDLKNQFAKFELTGIYTYTATLKLNGKTVKVEVEYGYYDGQYTIDEVTVYYSASEHFSVSPYAKDDLENYSPDNY